MILPYVVGRPPSGCVILNGVKNPSPVRRSSLVVLCYDAPARHRDT
jgi:hypothetical protein